MNKNVSSWIEQLNENLDRGIPGIYQIWQDANKLFLTGDTVGAKKYEQLIYLLHNSIVYSECNLGKVSFAYGGIGIVIHKNAEIRDGTMIGQGVTIGGTPGKYRIENNKRLYIPKINENCYIAAGSRILGGIEIGAYSIIGANSIVIKSINPLSVVAGNPAKLITTITLENCLNYKSLFPFSKQMTNEQYLTQMKKIISEFSNQKKTYNQDTNTLIFDNSQKNQINVITKIEDNKVHVSTRQNTIPLSNKPTFAYYLMYKGEKMEQRWYEKDHKVVFTLTYPNDLKNYNIIVFIRDKNNKKCKKKVNI